MATLREWLRRLWGTFRRNPRDREMEEELKSHVELAREEVLRRGGATEDVLRAARVRAGGVAQAMEAMRDQRGLPWLDDVGRDVHHALRSLRRSPAFTAVALLTLALGIGANTAIFSIVNGVLLQPLGYPKSEQLMYLSTAYPRVENFRVGNAEYLEFREMNRSFSSVGAFVEGEADLIGGERPRRVRSAAVDAGLLEALGIKPAQGRLFTLPETEVASNETLTTAILSHELWQSAFGGRPILGQTVKVDGKSFEVIGIMPPGMDLIDHRTEIWLPLGLNPANRQNRGSHGLYLIGRLKDGVTRTSAQTELDTLIRDWGPRVGAKEHVFSPLTERGGHILQMKPLQEQILGDSARAIWVLQAAVGFVLLIACANLANLVLARAETRQHEFAIRRALGASRGRLLRQFVTEGMLLSTAGGILGIALARVGIKALIMAYPTSLPRAVEVSLDVLVLLFTLAISVATGVTFALVPIIQARAHRLLTALQEGGARGATSATGSIIRRGLVVGEVALALMLVAGAGLLLRTVLNLMNVDAGFKPPRLVTFSLRFSADTYRESSVRVQAWKRLLGALRALPGVESATAVRGLPPERPSNSINTDIENYTAPPGGPFEVVLYDQSVMSNYFETMGIPIVAGRSFEPADAASTGRVVVVNETFVNTFWPGQHPIGRRMRRLGWYDAAWYTVIGVARDVKQGGLDKATGTEVYFFAEQSERSGPLAMPFAMNIVLRTSLPVAALAPTLERAVQDVDAAVPIVRLREMDEVFAESISRPRLLAQLVGGFSGLAVLLAAIGTYGVLAYTVAQRRREIGIRLALGANRFNLLIQVMKQGLLLTIIGIFIGLVGALALTRLMVSLLFGVEPNDVTTLGVVAFTITLVAAVACWLPAWRASRLDPTVMLRHE